MFYIVNAKNLAILHNPVFLSVPIIKNKGPACEPGL